MRGFLLLLSCVVGTGCVAVGIRFGDAFLIGVGIALVAMVYLEEAAYRRGS